MKYRPHLPQYCIYWLGKFHSIECERLAKDIWLFVGSERGLLIKASSIANARTKARSFIAHVSPKTDRRRKEWFYT